MYMIQSTCLTNISRGATATWVGASLCVSDDGTRDRGQPGFAELARGNESLNLTGPVEENDSLNSGAFRHPRYIK